jgi:hypothetical protein
VEPRSGPADGPTGDPIAPLQQRWRLVLARSAEAPRLSGRELADTWEAAVEATGLPVHRAPGRARTRVAFGAPLQLGIAAEHELADVFLASRLPIWVVRAALSDGIPEGWTLMDLFDVWVGGPALAGRVVAADYRIVLDDAVEVVTVAAAARDMLEARSLVRTRQKGETSVEYDLRPLVERIDVDATTEPKCLRVRTRILPELGTGRPEEVVAEIGDRLGRPVEIRSIVRERLILAGDQS